MVKSFKTIEEAIKLANDVIRNGQATEPEPGRSEENTLALLLQIMNVDIFIIFIAILYYLAEITGKYVEKSAFPYQPFPIDVHCY